MRDKIVAQEASIRVSPFFLTFGTVVGLGQWHYREAQLITPPERYPRPCESRDFGEVDGVGRSGAACELESREADVGLTASNVGRGSRRRIAWRRRGGG